ncbi:MAG: hypothetical protein JW882_04285 [Deltaproteobacteria bacterium]|nr:hypothetical protein [Deltaproteobacteria bacterium]
MFNKKDVGFYTLLFVAGLMAFAVTCQWAFANEPTGRNFVRAGNAFGMEGAIANPDGRKTTTLVDETGRPVRTGPAFSKRDSNPAGTVDLARPFLGGAGAGQYALIEKGFTGPGHGENLLKSIEAGTATGEDFIRAITDNRYSIEDISPSSVANYMEALANEGLLILIPSHYFNDEDIEVALNVVFEDRNNIFANWNVFENQWLPDKM